MLTAKEAKQRLAEGNQKYMEAVTGQGDISKLLRNSDGTVDIQDIIAQEIKLPGIRVNRVSFLRKELFKNHSEGEIIDAI